MSWWQLEVSSTPEQADELETVLIGAGADAVTVLSADNQAVFELAPGDGPMLWQRNRVVGLFAEHAMCEAAALHVRAQLGGSDSPAITCRPLAEQNWERSWMDQFRAQRFGDALWVCPSWDVAAPQGATVLHLDPGLAFGTGTHATTALCLEWLERQRPAGSVLDYGCGLGILAIAALLLSAESGLAVDIDPQALQATADNSARNPRVEGRLRTALAEAVAPSPAFDLVMANILAAPLIDLASTLAGFARPGADLLLSGILEHQTQSVTAAYRPWFDCGAPEVRDGWALIHGRRGGGAL